MRKTFQEYIDHNYNTNLFESIATNFINGNKKDCAAMIDTLLNKADLIEYLRAANYDDSFIINMMISYFKLCKF